MTNTRHAAWPDDPVAATGPLAGVRVLDLSTVVMGPSATQLLGDLGADVVKLEAPEGDSLRRIGPWRHPGMGALFLQANRNKRSVALDLKSAAGRVAAEALAARADLLVTNIRPDALRRLGLDPDTLCARHPRLIYCLAVGYGSDGPNAGQPVYDDLIQAAAGISGLFAAVDGAPRYAPVNLCDRIVGLYLATAALAALHHRDAMGHGQFVEVPMFETMAQFVLADHMGGAAFDPPAGAMGYPRLLSRARGPYATRDGYIAVVVYTDRHWRDFAALIGRPDLIAADPRLATAQSRTEHAEAIGGLLAAELARRGTAEWLDALRVLDIPACAVNSLGALLDDPHLKAVGMFATMTHPTEGDVTVARPPLRFARSPAAIRRLAPGLGAHNAAILGAGDTP